MHLLRKKRFSGYAGLMLERPMILKRPEINDAASGWLSTCDEIRRLSIMIWGIKTSRNHCVRLGGVHLHDPLLRDVGVQLAAWSKRQVSEMRGFARLGK